MKLSQLIEGLDIQQISPAVGEGNDAVDRQGDFDQVRVCDLTEDSRTAVPGSLFIARKGVASDGNRYVDAAIECGAVVILSDRDEIPDLDHDSKRRISKGRVIWLYSKNITQDTAEIAERFYGYPAKKLVCLGVTGTNGKSTVAEFTHQIIEQAGIRCGLIGTIEIDDGRERARASMTTPPSIELSRTLATMVEHGCQAVVMEASSHALDQGRVDGVEFQACAFTNLTGDHLDYHQTIEQYQASKARLFQLLKEDGHAVVCIDDQSDGVAHSASDAMISACAEGVRVHVCSGISDTENESVHLLSIIRVHSESLDGMDLELTTPLGTFRTHVPVFGSFNAMNILQGALLALSAMNTCGLDETQQKMALNEALKALQLPRGRYERVDTEADHISVLVDFAHTDDALKNALRGVRSVLVQDGSSHEIWCVFGCGGDRDSSKRPRMGQVVSELADRMVVTSDNPRTESPSQIISEILSGIDPDIRSRCQRAGEIGQAMDTIGTTESTLFVHSDRARAIEYAILNASDGDVVLIAGKGHELNQIVPDGSGGVRSIHFDDREHARIALRQRRFTQSSAMKTQ